MNEFQQAMAALGQAFVAIDTDGDGQPDTMVPANQSLPMPARQIPQQQTVPVGGVPGYARFAPMQQRGPEMRASNPSMGQQIGNMAYDAIAPVSPTVAGRVSNALSPAVDYGAMPAQGYVGQIDTAAKAMEKAYGDPSLPNVTNAGVQTAMTVGRPLAGAAILGGGMAAGLANDMGLGFATPAMAQRRKQAAPAQASVADLPGLTPEQNAQYKADLARIGASQFRSGADRRSLESSVKMFRDLSAEYMRTTNADKLKAEAEAAASRRAEYDRAVGTAETARDRELGRQTRFQDTNVGKIYEETGGFAPALLGFGAGAIGRMAHGGGSAFKNYGLPAIEGSLTTLAGVNAPLFYNAYSTPSDNVEKTAYQAYSRELPQDHPRKQEFAEYAGSLPDLNPVQTGAKSELFDPAGMGKRLFSSAIEGGPAGVLGANAVGVLARGGKAVVNALSPSGPRGGAPQPTPPTPQPPGPPTPQPTVIPNYAQLPSNVRGTLLDSYRMQAERAGAVPSARSMGPMLKSEALSQHNIAVPVSQARVANTNDIVEAFRAQNNGRFPTREELFSLLDPNRGTLGIGGAVAAGAGMNALSAEPYSGGY